MLNHFKNKVKINPQLVLFSATFDEFTIAIIRNFVPTCTCFRIQKEALKLKGVQMFRLKTDVEDKKYLVNEFYL